MQLAACITTRNRPQALDTCLSALWGSTVKPDFVIVSDDSLDYETQQKNLQIVQCYPSTTYKLGPRKVNAVSDCDWVMFVDDDICVEPDFIAQALEAYAQLPEQERDLIILTGVSRDQFDREAHPGKLNFRGYFCASRIPEAVVIHAAVFPLSLFREEQWDENIFFGYEDAELSLRALKRGYRILSMPELRVKDTGGQSGTLIVRSKSNLTEYELYIEAARLYVGVKRYKYLFPNALKLASFISIYFIHMIFYLLKRRSLQALPEIVRRAHL
jgi:GT2 family glycosyltransferase